jgi:serine/threonine protein kinase
VVAVKLLNLYQDIDLESFHRECQMLKLLTHHPSAVKFFGAGKHMEQYYIIQEYCAGSTLYDTL